MNKHRAFTLVELLVASLILFSVITTVSLIYRGAFIASEKANNHMDIVGVLPALLSEIQYHIRALPFELSHTEASGQVWQVHYEWKAKVIETKSVIDNVSSLEFGESNAVKKEFKLWQVELELSQGRIVREYLFSEVSWLDE
ncbi:hypothetical protein PULV_a3386 [Pseudoalteromonas ulvae UL12]|uniref:Prepilin-type N-terminal cleavage/methylation domain-containing protein n=1 Tax=Pseudoalteromonas ulvae TaxID=107327 RepID=A0A244CPU0_PSEDV|nr:type II secretion system protein [Pseudoalteromonas ulvae]MBE0365076.1 hypothetical protein [Pseudoalteromonas ulvae UL12]OUL57630.1 hypothetical protein B1199_11225 [Pseudoalteromonas ulvae]